MKSFFRRGGKATRLSEFQSLSPASKALKCAFSFGLLSALTLSGSFVSVLAEDRYPLQSIDFVSQGNNTTGILFHTGSHVPYRTILASDSKIVIDVDDVQADQTVKTNFANADNISHVVLQPLSKSTVRLIIRGEHLGNPKVAFKDVSAAGQMNNHYSEGGEDPFAEPKTSVKTSTGFGSAKTPASFESSGDVPVAEPKTEDSLSEEALTHANHDGFDKPAVLDGETASKPVSASETESAFHPAVNKAPEPPMPLNLSESDTLPNLKDIGSAKEASDFFGQLPAFDLNEGLKYGGLGAVIIGFVWFVRRKYISLSRRNQELYYDDSSRGNKRQDFQSLASEFQLGGKPGRNHQKTPSSGGGPIGLRALQSYMPEDDFGADTQQQDFGPALPPFVNNGRKNNASVAPKKQLINQYAQQQANTPPAGRGRQRISDDLLRQEVQRSAEIKRQAEQFIPPPTPQASRQKAASAASVIRKTAASTAPKRPGNLGKNGGALPPNPEVLNFLRSVADLMDKDGKTPVAGKPNPAQRRK